MISLISFKEDLIIPKEDAQALGIKYKKTSRIGFREEKLYKMNSYDFYREDCLKDDNKKYYASRANLDANKSIEEYYLYFKYTGDTEYVYVKKDNHLVNLFYFAPICPHKFYVCESVMSKEASIDNIDMVLQRIEEKASMLNAIVDKIKDNTFNKKTNVHVGGGLITTYNDLLLKEDVCTDVLQQELNNGWRIIAICVQADQRRPDYILGRYNPTLEVVDKPDAGR